VATDGDERTYGIWGFAAGFVVLCTVGLVAFLVLGNSTSPTVPVSTVSTTAPGRTTTTGDPATTAAPITVPGGGPAPAGATEVVTSGGVTSYTFAIPGDLAQLPVRSVVAPATAVPGADGRSLDLTVTCAYGAGEVLAQVGLTETGQSVTVLPVVVVPSDAPPCAAGEVVERVTVTLTAPLAGRPVDFVPAGTTAPTPAAG
jgi:hypothetical protein